MCPTFLAVHYLKSKRGRGILSSKIKSRESLCHCKVHYLDAKSQVFTCSGYLMGPFGRCLLQLLHRRLRI